MSTFSTHISLRIKSIALTLAMIAGVFASCGPNEPDNKVVSVTGVSVSPTTLSLEVDRTATLTATVSPSDAYDKTVTWSSSDQSVATVNNGTVSAIKEGKATITATAGGKSATCEVTVTAKVIPVTNIYLDPGTLSITVGKTGILEPVITPSNASGAAVTWSSSDQTVATVDNGTVTAVAEGTVTITATVGGLSATCSVTVTPDYETPIKAALMKIYNAMDGDNWIIDNYNHLQKWDLETPLNKWSWVEWDKATGNLKLDFHEMGNGKTIGLKGEFPDCFDELPWLTYFQIANEPGITGTLPPSFNKLKNLKELRIYLTSMTGLPDIFSGIPLEKVVLSANNLMTGPLPESLGSSPSLTKLFISGNNFTGTVPDSWAQLGEKLEIRREGFLDRRVPNSFVTAPSAGYLTGMYIALAHHHDFSVDPIEVGDYDIPAFWPEEGLKDVVSGKQIPYQEIYSKNKYTVLLNWGTWCPFSKVLMPNLKRMYEKYHQDGFEIIAAMNPTSAEAQNKNYKEIIQERGYDQWYNFSLGDFSEYLGLSVPWEIWAAGGTPSAIIVDNKGNIVRSSETNVSDPARNRFGYSASRTLIPWLEDQFGPLEEAGDYSSTDYSQDGKVITIQKASVGKGINLVFMGDAYTDKDIASGLYEDLMRACAEEFFSIEPYKSFQNRFNVYAVKVVSKNGKTGPGYETALNSSMVNGTAGTGNRDKILQYARKVSGITSNKNLIIGVLVNSIYHGGITDMIESQQSGIGYFSSMGNDHTIFGSTLRHEVGGHAFAFLGDEYAIHGSPSQANIDEINRLYNAYGWYSNVDFTNDPTKVKWSAFLSDDRYKGEVGIYEGGATFSYGVYRPSVNSMMRENMEYFNAPSRWAIYKRIMELSGETPSFSKFLEYDAINRNAAAAATSLAPSTRLGDGWVPDSPPVISR